jgi:hypothetical protein
MRSGLWGLEQQHARFDAEEERRSLELSLEKLRSVGDTIQRLPEHAGSS